MTEQTIVHDVDEALKLCGVTSTTLSSDEKAALDRDGYVVMSGVFDGDLLNRFREAFERAWGEDRSAGTEARTVKESGTRHVNGLVNVDAVVDEVFTNPRVLAAVYHVLRCSFRVGQINGRDPLPGFGQQGLHADWPARAKGEP